MTEDESAGIKEEEDAEGEGLSSNLTIQDQSNLVSPKKRGSRAKKGAVKKEEQVKEEHDLDQTEDENFGIKEEEEKNIESEEEI
jgi:hypothetical protein